MSKYFKPGKIVCAAGYPIDLDSSLTTIYPSNITYYPTYSSYSNGYLVGPTDNFVTAIYQSRFVLNKKNRIPKGSIEMAFEV